MIRRHIGSYTSPCEALVTLPDGGVVCRASLDRRIECFQETSDPALVNEQSPEHVPSMHDVSASARDGKGNVRDPTQRDLI
jgi:hypothetical protein